MMAQWYFDPCKKARKSPLAKFIYMILERRAYGFYFLGKRSFDARWSWHFL